MPNSTRILLPFLIASFAALNLATAEEPAPAAATAAAAGATTRPFIELPTESAVGVSYSGIGPLTLYDFHYETKRFAWNTLNLRIGFGQGYFDIPSSYISLYSFNAGLLLNFADYSSAGISNYLFLQYKAFYPSSSPRTAAYSGSQSAIEVGLGTTFFHTYKLSAEARELRGAAFIEAGSSISRFYAGPTNTDPYIANGFLIRLGIRRYL
jgi:hypothetical protein